MLVLCGFFVLQSRDDACAFSLNSNMLFAGFGDYFVMV